MKKLWRLLEKSSHVKIGRSLHERYLTSLQSYHAQPDQANATALEQLIGTSTPITDVLRAMETEFDGSFYLQANPDVRAAGIDPEYHYLFWGWREHRTPSKLFDPHFYRQTNKHLSADEFILGHYCSHGRSAGRLGNAISDHIWFSPFVPTEQMWSEAPSAMKTPETKATVIIPVYKGLEETLTSIYSALKARAGQKYSLLVVNDRSPDQELSDVLRKLANHGLFDYHHSETNRGFVKTINFAINHLTADIDVVLLNSDAYVNTGWFNRLISHAEKDDKVATVTPLSNNATICSYPLYDKDNYLALELSAEELDQLAASANKGTSVEAPTGVGFCFYMRRKAIQELGVLDEEAFLVGYGEENDFCMRALNAGWKNLIAGDVFVYHTGSVSFSSTKEENLARGQSNLERKHPNYPALVGAHFMADPERAMRRNIDISRLIKTFTGAVVIVTHKWSGGIETYLQHYIATLTHAGKKAIILRVHDNHKLTIEDPSERALFVPNLSNIDLRSDMDLVGYLLTALKPELIHVNSFAGLTWYFCKRMLDELTSVEAKKIFVCHDYSAISHHYQLLRPDNVFAGIPSNEELQKWLKMTDCTGSMDICDPIERQEVYQRFFESNVSLQAPSQAALRVYKTFFPSADISVVPHDDHLPHVPEATRRREDGSTRVVVIGAIGSHKGSDVLAALARDARVRELPLAYHLVGYSNDDDKLGRSGVNISGRYGTELEALGKIAEIQPDLILIPSIWHETFCYTLSFAMALRVPVAVFDIGAQGERVSLIDWGVTMPIRLSLCPSEMSDAIMSLDLDTLWKRAKDKGRSGT